LADGFKGTLAQKVAPCTRLSPEINKYDLAVSQFEQLFGFVFLNMLSAEGVRRLFFGQVDQLPLTRED
jgi:hypothetical protein